MSYFHTQEKILTRKRRLRQRLEEVEYKVQEGLFYAVEKLMQDRMDTYFIVEEKLEELERLFAGLTLELNAVTEPAAMLKLEKRFYYLEDSFEEIDSMMRNRPARYRNRFNLFDFLRRWQDEQADAPDPDSEILNSREAYEILGLPLDSDLKTVTMAFRRQVKQLHPDQRDGDRSQEIQLRKILAAYQYIKKESGRGPGDRTK